MAGLADAVVPTTNGDLGMSTIAFAAHARKAALAKSKERVTAASAALYPSVDVSAPGFETKIGAEAFGPDAQSWRSCGVELASQPGLSRVLHSLLQCAALRCEDPTHRKAALVQQIGQGGVLGGILLDCLRIEIDNPQRKGE